MEVIFAAVVWKDLICVLFVNSPKDVLGVVDDRLSCLKVDVASLVFLRRDARMKEGEADIYVE